MKKIAVVLFFLIFALSSGQSQNNELQKKSSNIAVDVQVRNLMQNLSTGYNLNHDQQLTLKKTALAFAESVSSAQKLNKSKKEKLKKDFDVFVLGLIPSEKHSNYKSSYKTTVNEILDNIIETVIKSKSSTGK